MFKILSRSVTSLAVIGFRSTERFINPLKSIEWKTGSWNVSLSPFSKDWLSSSGGSLGSFCTNLKRVTTTCTGYTRPTSSTKNLRAWSSATAGWVALESWITSATKAEARQRTDSSSSIKQRKRHIQQLDSICPQIMDVSVGVNTEWSIDWMTAERRWTEPDSHSSTINRLHSRMSSGVEVDNATTLPVATSAAQRNSSLLDVLQSCIVQLSLSIPSPQGWSINWDASRDTAKLLHAVEFLASLLMPKSWWPMAGIGTADCSSCWRMVVRTSPSEWWRSRVISELSRSKLTAISANFSQ